MLRLTLHAAVFATGRVGLSVESDEIPSQAFASYAAFVAVLELTRRRLGYHVRQLRLRLRVEVHIEPVLVRNTQLLTVLRALARLR